MLPPFWARSVTRMVPAPNVGRAANSLFTSSTSQTHPELDMPIAVADMMLFMLSIDPKLLAMLYANSGFVLKYVSSAPGEGCLCEVRKNLRCLRGIRARREAHQVVQEEIVVESLTRSVEYSNILGHSCRDDYNVGNALALIVGACMPESIG